MRSQALPWALLIAACSQGPSLSEYAAEFSDACSPGPAATSYIADTIDLSPDRRLALAYKRLTEEWVYLPDPPGLDHFASAEASFREGSYEGDCEDYSSAMAALCEILGLRSRLVLGESKDSGHAWLEVRIGTSADSATVIERLSLEFGEEAAIVHREEHAWLQMSPEGSLKKYKATHFIDTAGNLMKASVEESL